MAAQGRGPSDSLIAALRATPERFEFAQAVRLLERVALRQAQAAGRAADVHVGRDSDPTKEAARLRATLELSFPSTEVATLDETHGRAELEVTLMGLNGPSGVLPGYYSQLILESRRGRNPALRDFFDIFNHRALSLFVRAAEKYRLPLSSRDHHGDEGPVAAVIEALIGIRQESLLRRQAVSDDTLIFYGGHLSKRTPTAGALGQLLSDYFGSPARIEQFVGSWATLRTDEQSTLAAGGAFCQLGVNAVAGARVFDVQGSFRIGVGPLGYEQFLRLLPDAEQMAALSDLARTYAGPALNFDFQLTLKGGEVPDIELSMASAPRLGWNTWLPITGVRGDASDAIFQPADR
jgi:type VI secretion system protein ImpH